MHIFTDDQGTFYLLFSFYFASCYNSNVLQFECSIVANISEGVVSRETISFLTLL